MQNNRSLKISALQRLRALHRFLLSAGIGIFFSLAASLFTFPLLMDFLVGWIFFSISYLFICWYVIFTTPHAYIVKKAAIEDGSRVFVFAFILITCFACLGAVLSIIVNAKQHNISKLLWMPVSIGSIILSWFLVHTIYIFHYTHLYYQGGATGSGLRFPDDDQPNYLDFAYYSLCMGCTFQVSDVDITSKKLRQVTMYHGLISFALNTFLVAFTINIISGMIN